MRKAFKATPIFCVDLAQLIGADGFGKEKQKGPAPRRRPAPWSGHFPAHAGKRAHRPVVKVHDIGVVGKGDQKVRRCRADIADHNAAERQHAHVPDLLRHGKDKAHRDHRAQKRHCDQSRRRGGMPAR